MKKIQVLRDVYACDSFGVSKVVLAAGLHEVSPETERQVLLGNGNEVEVEDAAPAEQPAPEAAPAPAAAKKVKA